MLKKLKYEQHSLQLKQASIFIGVNPLGIIEMVLITAEHSASGSDSIMPQLSLAKKARTLDSHIGDHFFHDKFILLLCDLILNVLVETK